MPGLRRFSVAVETLAKEWRGAVVSDLPWVAIGKPGALLGSAAGYLVQHGELTGFAKPSQDTKPVPLAAQEKIAADLAFDLGLPVPPVVLWDRGDQNDSLHCFCAISLITFQPSNKWSVIHSVPVIRDRLLPDFTLAASGMIAFDTWFDNKDRLNDGNLVAAEMPGRNGVAYAYIDHGHTLTHSWADGPAPAAGPCVGPYPTQVTPDGIAVSAILAAIEGLSDDHIRAVVDRIPRTFITEKRKECISNGLCLRRSNLRGALAHLTGATP